MPDLKIARNVHFPDALRIARAKSLPNLGPRLLFFSGGSALNGISRRLKYYTHNSCHLITPFDSGGSSQVLREAFDMPAVGDLRSRLMALADETELGQPDIFQLFTYRFSKEAKNRDLENEFASVLSGEHDLMHAVSQPMRSLILSQLRVFAQHKPDDFCLKGASLGNLILAGGYLANERALEPVLFLMSKMVAVQGTVRSIVDRNLDLGARLADGTTIVGQRQITGKEVAPISSPIEDLYFVQNGEAIAGKDVKLPKRNRKHIEHADLICYPPGSLYTSVIANLLPRETGRTIARQGVPKVYIPSLGQDPECVGMDLSDRVTALLKTLCLDAGADCRASDLISAVICDQDAVDASELKDMSKTHNIPYVALPLRHKSEMEKYNPERVCDALLSLI
ncbi:GAK system CofD-like protein [Epibacterium ulvae]|uniref:GAK system CofD-like protein n=1 Tax=Epibacterium ulvae TaxID=1156985 RepID=UPI001BFC41CA|nr:GAK system CofD-like protein [Epibacterium ulvae]MBT8153460.1 GAK system CofD-like protein [Epibacterium ulvae]